MRRNCNLELRLFPLHDSHYRSMMMGEEANESPQQQHHHHHHHHHQQQQNQPLTIFYDGKICVCDVTEFQARTILMLASKESEERVRTPRSGSSEPSSPLLKSSSSSSQNNLNSPAAGTSLSMKRSLQRFLQKRKNRIQEASPYHH